MNALSYKFLRLFAPIVRKAMGPRMYRNLREGLLSTRMPDEVDAVCRALGKARAGNGIMIDVGGHRGESFAGFAKVGWRVDCFEPNPANHPAIEARISESRGQIRLFPMAVSDAPKQGMTFYISDQSTGISSLHAFHETHREGFKVDAIALRDHLAEQAYPKVDFLKIDTEGFDLFVLQGIDWNAITPEVIVCEFEDSKTESLGYTYKDMAQYLVDRGYEVIVSEWHPIEAYGQTHKWNRYTRFPSDLTSPQAWGNLVAMQPGIGADAVLAQLRKIGPVG